MDFKFITKNTKNILIKYNKKYNSLIYKNANRHKNNRKQRKQKKKIYNKVKE